MYYEYVVEEGGARAVELAATLYVYKINIVS
jgi:hypothetical protein